MFEQGDATPAAAADQAYEYLVTADPHTLRVMAGKSIARAEITVYDQEAARLYARATALFGLADALGRDIRDRSVWLKSER